MPFRPLRSRSLALPARAALFLAAAVCASCRSAEDPSLIQASGHVEATEIHVAAKVGGRLLDLPVREGDRVTEGQTLASLDTTDTRLALEQARAEQGAAEAEWDLRKAGARREDIAEAQAQLQSAEAELAGAEKDLERMESLLARGSGTEKARDDARVRRDVARARRDALAQASARLRSGSRPEEIEAARSRADASRARVASLEQQVADATVTAPAGGLVTEKIAEAGELLAPGAPLLTLTDLDSAWLTVYVAEPDLGRIRLGQSAEVVTDSGQRREGKVTFVASEAEFTPRNVQTRDERVKLVYRVKIGLDNADGLFKPGMPAEARLRAAA